MTMLHTMTRLEIAVAARLSANPDESYVASLSERGVPFIARKLGEEAVETVIAALSDSDEQLVGEAADLLFHLTVLLAAKGVPLGTVFEELDRREGTSGLTEKASRSL